MTQLSQRQLFWLLALAVGFRAAGAEAQIPVAVGEATGTAVASASEGRAHEALPEPPAPPIGAIDEEPADSAEKARPVPPRHGRSAEKSEQLVERAGARAAHAEPDGDEPSASPRRRWYGWQTLTADGASILVALTALGLEQSDANVDTTALSVSALLGYEFAPAIIHFAHKNPGRGFGSLGIRLGMPLAGAFLGASLASGCDEYLCEASGASLGFLLGVGGAIAIDAAVFAYDEPERRTAIPFPLLPMVAVTTRGAFIGLAGAL